MLKQISSFYACYTTKYYTKLSNSRGLWIHTNTFQPKYMNDISILLFKLAG